MTTCGSILIGGWGLLMVASRAFPALEEFAKGLPWYRPELAWLGFGVFLAVVLLGARRALRVRLARGVRVDLHPDHLRIEQGGKVHELRPAQLKGFSSEADDAVELRDGRGLRLFVPTPNEAVRVLVLNWLGEREVPRLGES